MRKKMPYFMTEKQLKNHIKKLVKNEKILGKIRMKNPYLLTNEEINETIEKRNKGFK
jgi:hypothetical protein